VIGASTYRAIQLQQFAPTFKAATALVALTRRAAGPGELRVRNLYCGVNGIFDTQIARNAVTYIDIATPTLTGVEALGVVEEVGDGVAGFAPGDAVVSVQFRDGYREENTAPASRFAKVPQAGPEWLALASTGVSAMVALEHVGALADGETVAISAAAGGLGHILVQLAKLRGCHVVAICGGPEKAAFAATLGADRVIDYRAEDVPAVLAAEYKDAIDVAVDTVGGAVFDAFLANLAPHGRLVAAGAASDLTGQAEIVTAPRVVHQIYFKCASIRGFMNGRLTGLWPAARERLFALYREGRLRIRFDDPGFTGLEDVYGAIDRLLSGASIGKVVVKLGEL
jgi:NADPH-dependent curcumin reductase CurA